MFHAAPIRWHALRALLGDVAFFDLLQTLQGQRDVSLEALRAAIDDPGNAAVNSLLDNWLDAGFGERIGLVSVQGNRDKTTNRWRVEASLALTGSLSLPIEIALITVHSDTVIDTIQPIATATLLSYRSPPLASPPLWIILDPFQKLPDLDRRDNLWRLTAPQKPRLVLPRGPETLGSVIFENR